MSRTLTTGARLTKSTTPRTLLLTFDAFETLFHPHPPVPDQYAATAHQFGLSRTAITPTKLQAAFKDVYRAEAKRHPNYGRTEVLRGQYGGPKQWWEDVIRGSFARALSSEQHEQHTAGSEGTKLPPGLMEALLDRFAGAGGYVLYEDVAPFFARMRELRASPNGVFDRVLVGVVSNSDDRVPTVLKALGLRVGDMRADQDLSSMALPGFEERGGLGRSQEPQKNDGSGDQGVDVDMVITSYEAGEEKPNRLIFDVARRQARLLVKESAHTHGSAPVSVDEDGDWVCVHVGDDYKKDYCAAIDAGWQSYLLARGESQGKSAKTISSLVELVDELGFNQFR